jgi:hypothetical protein
MGVLDNQPVSPIPSAERVAKQIKQQAKITYQQLLQVFNNGARQFWQNPQATPAEIAAALGTDAVEVFQLHGKIGALLATINPAVIAEGASVVGEFTYNADGTVTVAETTNSEPV